MRYEPVRVERQRARRWLLARAKSRHKSARPATRDLILAVSRQQLMADGDRDASWSAGGSRPPALPTLGMLERDRPPRPQSVACAGESGRDLNGTC